LKELLNPEKENPERTICDCSVETRVNGSLPTGTGDWRSGDSRLTTLDNRRGSIKWPSYLKRATRCSNVGRYYPSEVNSEREVSRLECDENR